MSELSVTFLSVYDYHYRDLGFEPRKEEGRGGTRRVIPRSPGVQGLGAAWGQFTCRCRATQVLLLLSSRCPLEECCVFCHECFETCGCDCR